MEILEDIALRLKDCWIDFGKTKKLLMIEFNDKLATDVLTVSNTLTIFPVSESDSETIF